MSAREDTITRGDTVHTIRRSELGRIEVQSVTPVGEGSRVGLRWFSTKAEAMAWVVSGACAQVKKSG